MSQSPSQSPGLGPGAGVSGMDFWNGGFWNGFEGVKYKDGPAFGLPKELACRRPPAAGRLRPLRRRLSDNFNLMMT